VAGIGEILDRKYRLTGVLGEGGMGVVFAATHLILGKQVAIKLLHPHLARDEATVQRLYREAQAAAAIGHEGVVEIQDVGWAEDGTPYLVMELLEGESLSQSLRRRGQRVSQAEAVSITCDILSILAAVHARGIIHRDLKPENIFLEDCEGGCTVKILDFGIAKAVSDQHVGRLTQTGTVVGTPYYMAPEQARGARGVDHRIDLWAVGAILYEILVGHVPYEGETYNEVLARIITEPVVPPRQRVPELDPALDAVVLKALASAAEDRYGSAQEFLADLRDLGGLATVSTAVDAAPAWAASPVEPEASREAPTPLEDVAPIAASSGAVPTTAPIAMRRRGSRLAVALVVAVAAVAAVLGAARVVSTSGSRDLPAPAPPGERAVATPSGAGPTRRVERAAAAPPAPEPSDGGSAAPSGSDEEPADASANREPVASRLSPGAWHERTRDARHEATDASRAPDGQADGAPAAEEAGATDAGEVPPRVDSERVVDAQLSRQEVASTLGARASFFHVCLRRSPAPVPAMQLQIRISGDGTATYLDGMPPPSAQLARCLRLVVAQTRFRASGGQPINVSYPIHTYDAQSRDEEIRDP
jgi:serine/threonine-protein kinase